MQVSANGLHLEVEDSGPAHAPVVLLLMGLGMQLTAWPEAWVAALRQAGYRVVRAWVALAWGLNAVEGLASTNKVATPRGPNSLASIRPLGPPPTMSTSVSINRDVAFMGSIWSRWAGKEVYPRRWSHPRHSQRLGLCARMCGQQA